MVLRTSLGHAPKLWCLDPPLAPDKMFSNALGAQSAELVADTAAMFAAPMRFPSACIGAASFGAPSRTVLFGFRVSVRMQDVTHWVFVCHVMLNVLSLCLSGPSLIVSRAKHRAGQRP